MLATSTTETGRRDRLGPAQTECGKHDDHGARRHGRCRAQSVCARIRHYRILRDEHPADRAEARQETVPDGRSNGAIGKRRPEPYGAGRASRSSSRRSAPVSELTGRALCGDWPNGFSQEGWSVSAGGGAAPARTGSTPTKRAA
jgi:hypothetical protein